MVVESFYKIIEPHVDIIEVHHVKERKKLPYPPSGRMYGLLKQCVSQARQRQSISLFWFGVDGVGRDDSLCVEVHALGVVLMFLSICGCFVAHLSICGCFDAHHMSPFIKIPPLYLDPIVMSSATTVYLFHHCIILRHWCCLKSALDMKKQLQPHSNDGAYSNFMQY